LEIVKRERIAFQVGAWKNFEELEEELSLDELDEIILGIYEAEERRDKFVAAVNGLDYDGDSTESDNPQGTVSRETIERRAKLRLEGKSEEEIESADLESLGLFAAESW